MGKLINTYCYFYLYSSCQRPEEDQPAQAEDQGHDVSVAQSGQITFLFLFDENHISLTFIIVSFENTFFVEYKQYAYSLNYSSSPL